MFIYSVIGYVQAGTGLLPVFLTAGRKGGNGNGTGGDNGQRL